MTLNLVVDPYSVEYDHPRVKLVAEHQNSNDVSSSILNAVQENSSLMESLLNEIVETRDTVNALNSKVRDIDWLVKIVRDGNGSDSPT